MAAMAGDGAKALRDELGAPPPQGLVRALDDAELGHIAQAVREARRSQTAALAAAGTHALDRLPKVLRVPVKRLVGA
jgi:hypothetical protein